MSSNFHSGLLKDISSMVIDSDEYNIIQIKENQNIKEFRAHSNILRARSPYFKNLISNKFKNESNVVIFNKPYITSIVFEIVLK